MAAAVIQLTASSGAVTNLIAADATKDFPPAIGTLLVNIPSSITVNIGDTWASSIGFIAAPLPPPSTTAISTSTIFVSTITSTSAVIISTTTSS